jgi:Tfp pilus assembly protein PilF
MGHSPPSFSPSDNPAASEDSWLTRTLTFLYLPALNMWLLLYPRTLSFDWSMDAVPLVRGISDSRNVMTIALYASLGVLSFYILRSIKTRKSQPISFDSTFSNSFTSMPSSPALQHNTNMSNRNVYPPPGMSLKMRHPFHQISHETGSVPSLKPVQITHFSRRASATARIMLVGLAFLVIPFVPASNLLFHVGFVVAERVLYIPSLGFCILVAHGVSVLYEKCSSDVFRKILIVLCIVTLALLSWRTYLRNQDWHDEESFYRSGIGTNSAKAWGNLGNTLTNNGRHEEAEIAYQNAIKHRPNMADAHYNYGTLLLNMGRYEDASKRFQDAITYRPKLAAAYLNLGIVLTNINRRKEAEKVYRDCSVISDEGLKNPKGHMSSVTSCLFNLGKVLLEDSNAKDAVRTLLKAVEVAPYGYGLQGVYNLLGEAYSTIGENQMAVKFFRRSLESRPGHLPAVIGFAKLLQGQGHFSEALAILGEGKRHHPERTEIYVQEGIVRLSNKEVSQAKESFNKAIAVSPLEDVDVVISAAHSFREHGNMADAERYYRLAVERQPNVSAGKVSHQFSCGRLCISVWSRQV